MGRRRGWGCCCALLLAIAAGGAGAQGGAGDWRGARPAVALELEPGVEPQTWSVLVSISDLRDGRVLAQPRLEVQAGTPGVIEAGVEGAVRLRLEVGVDSTGTRATWQFVLRDGDVVLTEQRATLTLAKPAEAAY